MVGRVQKLTHFIKNCGGFIFGPGKQDICFLPSSPVWPSFPRIHVRKLLWTPHHRLSHHFHEKNAFPTFWLVNTSVRKDGTASDRKP